MFVHAIFAPSRRQNRVFGQNATEREKRRDWMAEKIGFELVVAFCRTIAPYWPTECVFRLSAAKRESKPKIGHTGHVGSQCEPDAFCAHFRPACLQSGVGNATARSNPIFSAFPSGFFSRGGVLLKSRFARSLDRRDARLFRSPPRILRSPASQAKRVSESQPIPISPPSDFG